MTSRSLLKENAGLLEIVQRLLDPILVVTSGAVLYASQFDNWDLPLNYVFLLISGFLLCLVTFLLATPGFANFARLSSSANVPGKILSVPEVPSKRLHVDVQDRILRVTWRSGATCSRAMTHRRP